MQISSEQPLVGRSGGWGLVITAEKESGLSKAFWHLHPAKVEKDWKLKNAGQRYLVWMRYVSKIYTSTRTLFPGKIHLVFAFWFVTEIVVF